MRDLEVTVTGMGVVASNGKNINDFFDNCMKGIRGINDGEVVFEKEGLRTAYYGSIPDDVMENLHPEIENNVKNRASKMALSAADEALSDANLTYKDIEKLGGRCAFLSGSLCQDDYYLYEFIKDENRKKTDEILYLSDFSLFMKEKLHVGGFSSAVSSACSSGSVILGYAYELIDSGMCDVVLACGIDELTKNNVYGFHALKSMSFELCHPLDKNRDGINIGEGCGFVVLESGKHAKERGAHIHGLIKGYSIGNEAYHITSPDASGAGFYASMKNALLSTNLEPEDIDYVNLHGTGTPVNDSVELMALNKLYENSTKKPALSSLKTLTGHCMGASGVLEAIITVLGLERGKLLPITHVNEPIDGLEEYEKPENVKEPVYAMSNSFAFAGNTATVVFCKCDDQNDKKDENSKREKEYCIYKRKTDEGVYIRDVDVDFAGKNNENSAQEEKHIIPDTTGVSARKLRGITPLSKMALTGALRVSKRVWGEDGEHKPAPERVGTLFSSKYGALDTGLKMGVDVVDGRPDHFNPNKFANTSRNAPVGILAANLNAKGSSTAFLGTFPLPYAAFLLEKNSVDEMICCSGEEYSEDIDYMFKNKTGYSYDESMVTFLMQRGKSEDAYCAIDFITSVNIGDYPKFGNISDDKITVAKDMFFSVMGDVPKGKTAILKHDVSSSFDEEEKRWIDSLEDEITGVMAPAKTERFLNNTLSANVGFGANWLKNSNEKESGKEINNIIVTGYDVGGNYYIVSLRKE